MAIDQNCVGERAFFDVAWYGHKGKEGLHYRGREIDPTRNRRGKQRVCVLRSEGNEKHICARQYELK